MFLNGKQRIEICGIPLISKGQILMVKNNMVSMHDIGKILTELLNYKLSHQIFFTHQLQVCSQPTGYLLNKIQPPLIGLLSPGKIRFIYLIFLSYSHQVWYLMLPKCLNAYIRAHHHSIFQCIYIYNKSTITVGIVVNLSLIQFTTIIKY